MNPITIPQTQEDADLVRFVAMELGVDITLLYMFLALVNIYITASKSIKDAYIVKEAAWAHIAAKATEEKMVMEVNVQAAAIFSKVNWADSVGFKKIANWVIEEFKQNSKKNHVHIPIIEMSFAAVAVFAAGVDPKDGSWLSENTCQAVTEARKTKANMEVALKAYKAEQVEKEEVEVAVVALLEMANSVLPPKKRVNLT